MEMALKSPIFCWPLGLFDCCGVSDGAAALILTTPEIAKDRVGEGNYATIKGIGMSVQTKYPFMSPTYNPLSFTSIGTPDWEAGG